VGEIFEPDSAAWYHHYKTVNVLDTNKRLEGLEYIFVELPKFKPTMTWEKKLGVLWLRFLNEISTMTEIPTEFRDVPELCKAMELSQESAFTRGELEAYDQYWDAMSTDKTRTVDAWAGGKAEGLSEGKTEGLVDAAYKAIMAGVLTIEAAKDVFGLTGEQEALLRTRLT
jgi:hypothetical protein